MNSAQFISGLAAAVALTAAVSDIRERRIPNRLTYPAMIAGLALQVAFHGWRGLLLGVEGGVFFGGVFLIFYLVRAMGAGDVKLAAALGCMAGPAASFHLMYATAIAGGALAIIFMMLSGRIVHTVRNTFWVLGFHARHGLQTHPVVNLDTPARRGCPMG